MNDISDRPPTSTVVPIGVLGAASLVGRPLVESLTARGIPVVACSRRPPDPARPAAATVTWCLPGAADPIGRPVPRWITVCPLWSVPEHLPWLEALGVRSLVAISSTSVLTKRRSPEAGERAVAARLAEAERTLAVWGARRAAAICLLRPTMIYDGVTDGNIAAIAAFIRRRGWFPVAGPARGLRQPVHAADVAAACLAALEKAPLPQTVYAVSGLEPTPFTDLVAEVFTACGRRPRILHVPRWLAAIAAPLVDRRGRISLAGMAARMNDDLSCDHGDAARDLGFDPRPCTAATLAAGFQAATAATGPTPGADPLAEAPA